MRILILASEWPPHTGGVAALSYEQALGLAQLGCEVQVLALISPSGDASSLAGVGEHPQLTVLPLAIQSGAIKRLPALMRAAVAAARKFRPDLIHCPAYRGFGLPAWLAARLSGSSYALYFHGTELQTDGQGGLRRTILRWCLRGASLVLSNSHNTAAMIREVDPNLRVAVHAVHPGARLKPFMEPATLVAAVHRREEWLRQSGLEPELWDRARILVAICRMHRGKGLDVAIEALATRTIQPGDPPLIYVLVGSGPHEAELRALVQERDLGHRVIFAGPAPYGQTAACYLAADGYLQPSHSEGPFLESYGIAFVEAQAAGLPCIGTNWGGVPEATRPGETAWLVEPHSVAGVVEALDHFCRLSEDERAMIGHRGRQFASTRTWADHCERLRDLIRQECPQISG